MSAPIIDPIVDPTTPAEPKKAELQLREIAKENARINAELEALKQKEAEREAEILAQQGEYQKLYEAEKAEKQAILEQRNQDLRQAQILRALKNAGINPDVEDFVTPEFAKKVEFDENNNPKNLETALQEFVEIKPSLFVQAPTIPAGSVGVQATTSQSTGMTKQQAEEILNSGNYDVISKNQKEISQALNN